ncbi:MAG: dethiobiotin synthase [Myxococcota bacterium]
MTIGWIITGTDTDVGKTVITACLAEAYRSNDQLVRAIKPIESGVFGDGPGQDAIALATAAGHEPQTWATLTAAVSPHRAQHMEGRTLEPDALRAWLKSRQGEVTLIEGAGGWRVPLMTSPTGERVQLSALATWVDLPVLVVARDRLGVLNHTCLTIEAIQRDGHRVAGIILNRVSGGLDDPSRASNEADLRELTGLPMARVDAFDPSSARARRRIGEQVLSDLSIPVLRA